MAGPNLLLSPATSMAGGVELGWLGAGPAREPAGRGPGCCVVNMAPRSLPGTGGRVGRMAIPGPASAGRGIDFGRGCPARPERTLSPRWPDSYSLTGAWRG